MKKVLLFSILCVAIFLTGCTKNESGEESKEIKHLVCSQKVQTVDVNMLADFTGDELTYLGLKYEMDLSAYTDTQIEAIGKQDMCTTVKASMSSYTDAFTNCKQSLDNKVLIITADFDLTKLISSDIKREAKIEDVKESLEKQSYSCTIN